MNLTPLALICLMVGCKAIEHPGLSSSDPTSLLAARKSLEAGELYQAKKLTNEFLEVNPEDDEAQQLMAKILDEEIAQHMEIFKSKAVEEFTDDERENEIKTWLERGKALLEIGEYEEAMLAAENDFQYEPENQEASRLMDEIKRQGYKVGKKELFTSQELISEEVDDRIGIYRKQMRDWMMNGQRGAAGLAAKKILMLRPEDNEARNVLEQTREN